MTTFLHFVSVSVSLHSIL